MDLTEAINTVRDRGFDPMILNQIKNDGLGADLIIESELDENSQIRIVSLVTYLYAQRLGFGVIRFLCNIFSQVELLEQCGDFYKLRVPTDGYTIGWLFGQI